MRYIDFVHSAPCRDADPSLFDATSTEESLEGLEYCRHCPLWSECDTHLEPAKNSYDGIAVGAVWKDGRIVAMLRSRIDFKRDA